MCNDLSRSAFVGLGVMMLFFPIPGYISKLIQTAQISRMKKVNLFDQLLLNVISFHSSTRPTLGFRPLQKVSHKNDNDWYPRLTWRNSAMNVIRMVKLFGWEPRMQNQIAEKREEELSLIRRRQLLDILNGSVKYELNWFYVDWGWMLMISLASWSPWWLWSWHSLLMYVFRIFYRP